MRKHFALKCIRRKSHATNIFYAKYIFRVFIFVVSQAYENILTKKISRFTVLAINSSCAGGYTGFFARGENWIGGANSKGGTVFTYIMMFSVHVQL